MKINLPAAAFTFKAKTNSINIVTDLHLTTRYVKYDKFKF